MAVTFAPRLAYSGFDRSVTPKWQMVPVGGERVLTVSGAGGLVPRVRDSSILEATQTVSGRVVTLKLKGLAAGRTWVEWVPNAAFAGPVQASNTLEVSVKAQKVVRTAFHYVTDGARQVTRRRIADVDRLITVANQVLRPQSNVVIQKKSAAELAIAQNLGDIVRFSAHLTGAPDNVPAAQHEWDVIIANRDTTADFNVFFVKEFEQDNTPYRDNTEAGTIASDKSCIFEDRTDYSAGRILAHETIHLLGMSGHSAGGSHLMSTTASGTLITRDQANLINPSGT